MPPTRRVPAWGRLDSRLVVVAEAPGQWEVKRGQPLVGPSGRLWQEWITVVGLKRSDFYIMNTMEYMCPGSQVKNAPRDEVEAWAATVPARLAKLDDPWLIVPLGEVALRAVLGVPLWSSQSPKIGTHRGSVLGITLNGRTVKVIASFHPAATFREPSLAHVCRLDWQRIASDSQFRELRLPVRNHIIPPVPRQVIDDYLHDAALASSIMAIDIETTRDRQISCVGFALVPEESMTLPFKEYRREIKALCESRCAKVGQNFLYDRFYLAHFGIDVCGEIWDTLAMHHALWPSLPHSLAFMASTLLRSVYWKSERKDADSPTADMTPGERLWTYCGKDVCATRSLHDILHTTLADQRGPAAPTP